MKTSKIRLLSLCAVCCFAMGLSAQRPLIKGVKRAKGAAKAVKVPTQKFKPNVNVPAVLVHETRKANEAYSRSKKDAVDRSVLPSVRPHVPSKVRTKTQQFGNFRSSLSASGLYVLDSIRREKCVRRFVKYAKVNNSCADAGDTSVSPSSLGQRMMAKLIEQDIRKLAKDSKNMQIACNEDGCVYVKFPATTTAKKPSLMFAAHLDVAPNGVEGTIHPIVHRKYKGGDIQLSSGIVLSPNAPQGRHLKNCVGKTIITGDGATSLGVGGKAGCVVLMSLIDRVAGQGVLDHGDLYFVFSRNANIDWTTERFPPQWGVNPDVVIDVDGDVPDHFSVEENKTKHMQPTLADIIKNAYAFCDKTATPHSERSATTSGERVTKGVYGRACVFSGQQAVNSAYEWTCVEDMLDMVNILHGVIVQVKNM